MCLVCLFLGRVDTVAFASCLNIKDLYYTRVLSLPNFRETRHALVMFDSFGRIQMVTSVDSVIS